MRKSLLMSLMLALGLSLGAQELGFSFIGPKLNFLLLGGVPVPTGAEFSLSYPVAESALGPTKAVLRLAPGYEDKRLVRDDLTGDPREAPVDADSPYRFHSPNMQWDLGVVQGLARKEQGNLIEAFLLYRGRYDRYQNELATAVFPDARGLMGTSFMLGAAYDAVEKDSRRVKSGLSAESSFEWGPSFLNSGFGASDFWRTNLQAEAYLPVFSYGNGDLNLLSGYLACFASYDQLGGKQIPIYALQSFGGRDLRTSLGGSVRGYPSKTYDAALKLVANLEARILGPALLGQAWLIPIVYGFYDAGFYSGLPSATSAWKDSSGLISSLGGGFALDLFDFAYAGFRTGLLLPGDDELFPVYLPGKRETFFSIEFLLHF